MKDPESTGQDESHSHDHEYGSEYDYDQYRFETEGWARPQPKPLDAFERLDEIASLTLGSLLIPLFIGLHCDPPPSLLGYAFFSLPLMLGAFLMQPWPGRGIVCPLLYLTGTALAWTSSPLALPLMKLTLIPLVILAVIRQVRENPSTIWLIPALLLLLYIVRP